MFENLEWVQVLTKDPVTLGLTIAVAILSIIALTLLFRSRKAMRSSQNRNALFSDQSTGIRNPNPNLFNEITQVSPEVAPQAAPALATTSLLGTGSNQNEAASSLFGATFSRPNDSLPQIDPADIPHADKSDRFFGPLTNMFASLLPESDAKKVEVKKELRHAGYYNPHAWHNLASVRYLAIIIPLIALGILLLFVPSRFETLILIAMIVFPIMGWALPRLLVRSQANSRMNEIEHGMPDMIDMLNMCVSQGLSLLPSLKRVGGELTHIHPALSQELKIVSEQAELGTLDQALTNFSDRVDVPEVHSFTTLLTQTERMGTSVSSSLADYADNMREGLKQRADEKANTAAFKILFPTALCLMPAVFLFLLGPSIIELSNFFFSGSEVLNATTDTFQNVIPSEVR